MVGGTAFCVPFCSSVPAEKPALIPHRSRREQESRTTGIFRPVARPFSPSHGGIVALRRGQSHDPRPQSLQSQPNQHLGFVDGDLAVGGDLFSDGLGIRGELLLVHVRVPLWLVAGCLRLSLSPASPLLQPPRRRSLAAGSSSRFHVSLSRVPDALLLQATSRRKIATARQPDFTSSQPLQQSTRGERRPRPAPTTRRQDNGHDATSNTRDNRRNPSSTRRRVRRCGDSRGSRNTSHQPLEPQQEAQHPDRRGEAGREAGGPRGPDPTGPPTVPEVGHLVKSPRRPDIPPTGAKTCRRDFTIIATGVTGGY